MESSDNEYFFYEHECSLDEKIGAMRQWLNEDRIKDADRFVTNEELLRWLI